MAPGHRRLPVWAVVLGAALILVAPANVAAGVLGASAIIHGGALVGLVVSLFGFGWACTAPRRQDEVEADKWVARYLQESVSVEHLRGLERRLDRWLYVWPFSWAVATHPSPKRRAKHTAETADEARRSTSPHIARPKPRAGRG